MRKPPTGAGPPGPGSDSLKRTLAVALLAVGLVGLVVTPLAFQGPNLTVTDGSITGVIEGNLTASSTISELVSDFNATTYANQSGFPASTLSLRLQGWTYYDSGSQAVLTNIMVTVLGRLASSLRPTGFQLAYNHSGPNISATSNPGFQAGSNVSYNGLQGFSCPGSNSLSGTITGGDHGFSYSDLIVVTYRPQYNHFLGLRVALLGLVTPVGVGVLLKIINVPGGSWG